MDRTGQYYDPTQHWAALLRYDASRRPSTDVDGSSANRDGSLPTFTTFHKPTRAKQMSIGDDLPHMPEKASDQGRASFQRPSLPRGAQAPWYGTAADTYEVDTTQDDIYGYEEELTLTREVTPQAFKGENAILVDRELERLRQRRPMAKRMKWRILTGTSMLLALAFTAYIFAHYLTAYLALSPSNWFLSDSQDGTRVSPDPLLRSMAMLELIITGIALLGVLASGFYLRMTRRRSCGRGLIWFTAIVSTTLNTGLSLANIALIVAWHKQYTNDASNQLARTRDVGLRCAGTWDMDLLWSAASNSLIAKPDDDPASSASSCRQEPVKTLQSFLIAGGVRLAVFVILSTVWLICLGRYNATSSLVKTLSSDETIEESPEMHKLLVQESGLPEMPTMKSVPDGFGGYTEEEESQNEKGAGNADSVVSHAYKTLSNVAPPKIDRFNWQRGDHSGLEPKDEVQTFANIGRNVHERESSAGAWSRSFMDRVYSALWGDETEVQAHEQALARAPTDQQTREWHGRETTRLGVRGWFASRDMSQISDESETDDDDDATVHGQDEDVDITDQAQGRASAPEPVRSTSGHDRSPSQEQRARQSRHTSSQRVQSGAAPAEMQDRYTTGLRSKSTSHTVARERSTKRKQEQQDRLTFLANMQFDRRHGDEATATVDPPVLPPKRQFGDQLLPMPTVKEMQTIAPSSSSFHEHLEDGIDEDDHFWHAAPVNRTPDGGRPSYVRQLGKLVHRLSAIESVGSGEQSQHRSRSSREPSAASALY